MRFGHAIFEKAPVFLVKKKCQEKMIDRGQEPCANINLLQNNTIKYNSTKTSIKQSKKPVKPVLRR